MKNNFYAIFGLLVLLALPVFLITVTVKSYTQPALILPEGIDESILDKSELLGSEISFYNESYITSPRTYEFTIEMDTDRQSVKGLWYSDNGCSLTIEGGEKTVTVEGDPLNKIKLWGSSLSSRVSRLVPKFESTVSFSNNDIGKTLKLIAYMWVHYPGVSGYNEFSEHHIDFENSCEIHVVSDSDYQAIKEYYNWKEVVAFRPLMIIGAGICIFILLICLVSLVNYLRQRLGRNRAVQKDR